MKAAREVGWRRLARYGGWSGFSALLRATPTPVLRAALLRLAGATIGPGTIIQPGLRLENADRHRGLGALAVGRDCWIGHDVHLDLAEDVVLGDQVTLSSRTVVNTHLHVGYADHPLHAHVGNMTDPVVIGSGSFVGVGAILLAGTRLGEATFVAAGAVVRGEHAGSSLLAGVPAKRVRSFGGPT